MYKKVGVILALVLFLITAASAQPNVERTAPITAVMNETMTVTLKVTTGGTTQSAIDVIEFLPMGWEVLDWDVAGYNKSLVSYEYASDRTFAGKERSAVHWGFKNVKADITITYHTKAISGIYSEFITVWTYPEGFSSKTTLATVLPKAGIPYCGNGMCDSGENVFNCPQDCNVQLQITMIPIDLTLVLTLAIISLIITAFVYKYTTRVPRIPEFDKRKLSLEELRAYLKLGLRRGYQVSEMINALRGSNIDVSLLEEIERSERVAKAEEDIRKILTKPTKVKTTPEPKEYDITEEPDDAVISKLKGIIGNLKDGKEVKIVVEKLEDNGVNTELLEQVKKSKQKPKRRPRLKKIPEDDEVIEKLKEIIGNMTAEDKNNIYKEIEDSM